MSPEKLLNDPNAIPFVVAMAAKGKNFIITKGLAAFGFSALTFAFSTGIFYGKMDEMHIQYKSLKQDMSNMQSIMNEMQRTQAVLNNNMVHVVEDIEGLTAQVGQLMSRQAKIRR